MKEISIIGLDLAKSVFQVHGADGQGNRVLSKQLKRKDVLAFFAKLSPCVVAMEACGTSHYWGREIARLGHQVRLIPASYVKPYVKRGKNDAIDAEAIVEAAIRPTMRFVPLKTMEAQEVGVLHRTRDLMVKNRTMLVNALRSHLAEFGFIAAKGIGKLKELCEIVQTAGKEALPDLVRSTLLGVIKTIASVQSQIAAIEKKLLAVHKANAESQRVATIPGVGILAATALCGLTPEARHFKNGRHFAAWLGLTPKQDTSGGKIKLKRISKAGDKYLRRLLVLGATSLLKSLQNKTTPLALWVQGLLARCSRRSATVAIANKLARIAWAVRAKNEVYRTCAA
jgi:transposase